MKEKFSILRGGRGIAFIYEIVSENDFQENEDNTFKVTNCIFLNVDKKVIGNEGLLYLIEGVKKMSPYVKEKMIRFRFKSIEIDYLHFKPEAMYYAFIQWFCREYHLDEPPINIQYIDGKFVFPDLINIRG